MWIEKRKDGDQPRIQAKRLPKGIVIRAKPRHSLRTNGAPNIQKSIRAKSFIQSAFNVAPEASMRPNVNSAVTNNREKLRGRNSI